MMNSCEDYYVAWYTGLLKLRKAWCERKSDAEFDATLHKLSNKKLRRASHRTKWTDYCTEIRSDLHAVAHFPASVPCGSCTFCSEQCASIVFMQEHLDRLLAVETRTRLLIKTWSTDKFCSLTNTEVLIYRIRNLIHAPLCATTDVIRLMYLTNSTRVLTKIEWLWILLDFSTQQSAEWHHLTLREESGIDKMIQCCREKSTNATPRSATDLFVIPFPDAKVLDTVSLLEEPIQRDEPEPSGCVIGCDEPKPSGCVIACHEPAPSGCVIGCNGPEPSGCVIGCDEPEPSGCVIVSTKAEPTTTTSGLVSTMVAHTGHPLTCPDMSCALLPNTIQAKRPRHGECFTYGAFLMAFCIQANANQDHLDGPRLTNVLTAPNLKDYRKLISRCIAMPDVWDELCYCQSTWKKEKNPRRQHPEDWTWHLSDQELKRFTSAFVEKRGYKAREDTR